jgi:hypothetical protein
MDHFVAHPLFIFAPKNQNHPSLLFFPGEADRFRLRNIKSEINLLPTASAQTPRGPVVFSEKTDV